MDIVPRWSSVTLLRLESYGDIFLLIRLCEFSNVCFLCSRFPQSSFIIHPFDSFTKINEDFRVRVTWLVFSQGWLAGLKNSFTDVGVYGQHTISAETLPSPDTIVRFKEKMALVSRKEGVLSITAPQGNFVIFFSFVVVHEWCFIYPYIHGSGAPALPRTETSQSTAAHTEIHRTVKCNEKFEER